MRTNDSVAPLRRHFRRAFRPKVLALLFVASFLGAQQLVGPALEWSTGPAHDDAAPSSASLRIAVELIERHDCWIDQAPLDVELPGHAVVTRGDRTWYAGPRVVGLALDQVFAGVDHGLTVHAFCR